jgi:replicative DNA helicase
MNETNHNTRLEKQLVAQLISSSGDYFAQICNVVSEDDFSDKTAAIGWRACCHVYDSGNTINVMNVYHEVCKEHGTQKAADVISLPSETNGDIIGYAITIHELAQKRRLATGLEAMQELLDDPTRTSEEVADQLANLCSSVRTNNGGVTTWADLSVDLLKRVQDIMNGVMPQQVLTGFDYIDHRGGLKAGNLDIIAGRTSNGKTALAMAIAVNTAMAGNKVAVYSMEMTLEELASRIGSMLSRVPVAQIDRGPLSEEEFSQVYTKVCESDQAPIYFDKYRTADIDKVVASIRQMAVGNGVRVVVLDYIQQLTSTRHKDKRSLVSDACVRLKNLAVELGITIIALSQLARPATGGNNKPPMNQLKEAGEIENSADNVYLVYRAELYGETYPDDWATYSTAGTALVFHTKARSGAIGDYIIGFQPECVRYFDMDHVEQVEDEYNGFS